MTPGLLPPHLSFSVRLNFVTLSDCLSVGKREMQNFRVGKDLLTDRHHINIYVAGPFYVPGMT